MNSLNLQNYLRTSGSLELLKNELGVYSKRHTKYTNLVQFTYDQIESFKNPNHPLVLESRGIILDESNDWKVVAYPFNRFFNYGEVYASEIDWDTAEVQEKIDGSLMIMYFYDNKWHVATRNSPTANGNVGEYDFTFCDLFWKAFDNPKTNYFKRNYLTNHTYCFELTSKYNQVVCSYEDEPKLTLLGMRNNDTFKENYAFEGKTFSLKSFNDVKEAAKTLEPSKQEGYVVVDAHFNRVKIKSPKYVYIHHLKSGLNSTKNLVELARTGESSEVFAYFPDFKEKYEEVFEKISKLVSKIQLTYFDILKHQDKINDFSQKSFALEAVKYPYSSALFSFHAKKIKDFNEYVKTIHVDKLVDLLEIK